MTAGGRFRGSRPPVPFVARRTTAATTPQGFPDVPGPNIFGAMAYDEANAVPVMHVVPTFPSLAGVTWTWDGAAWVPVSYGPAAGSSAVVYTGAAMAWDGAQVIMFGGSDFDGNTLDTTYAWDGATWTLLTPGTTPVRRFFHAMAWDPGLGKVVMFGGDNDVFPFYLDDTWTWDGSDWTQESPSTVPTARASISGAYDGTGAVIYGGRSDSLFYRHDTFRYSGGDWHDLSPATTPRTSQAYTLTGNGTVILQPGDDGSPGATNHTFAWGGSDWTDLGTPGVVPQGPTGACSALDSGGDVIVYGGSGGGGYTFDHTYKFAAGVWSDVTPP